MNKKQLTIGVPVFNGEETIELVLDSIYNAMKNSAFSIDLIISNNGSNDNTGNICKNYKSTKSIEISYFENSKNEGFDANVINIVKNTKTKYLWTLSDNEIIVDRSAIAKILDMLNKYKPLFLFLNHNNNIKLNHVKEYYENADTFFCDTKFKSGLISNCVFDVEKCRNVDVSSYIGKQWIHFAYQIEILSPKNKNIGICVLLEYLFKSIPAPQKWGGKGSFIETGINLADIFSNMKDLGYSESTVRASLKVIESGYPFNICLAKKQGYQFTNETLGRMDKHFNTIIKYRILDRPIAKMPTVLTNVIYYVILLINNTKRIIRKIARKFMFTKI